MAQICIPSIGEADTSDLWSLQISQSSWLFELPKSDFYLKNKSDKRMMKAPDVDLWTLCIILQHNTWKNFNFIIYCTWSCFFYLPYSLKIISIKKKLSILS